VDSDYHDCPSEGGRHSTDLASGVRSFVPILVKGVGGSVNPQVILRGSNMFEKCPTAAGGFERVFGKSQG